MKSALSLLLLSSLTFLGSCSGDEIEAKMKSAKDSGGAMMDNLQNLDLSDLSSMSTDKLKDMFSGASSSLVEQLSSVKDLADANSLKDKVAPLLDQLTSLKGALGDKMPSMDSLSSAVTSLKDRFAGDNSVMDVLQPILDKLQGLMG